MQDDLHFNSDGSLTEETKNLLANEGVYVDEKINSIVEKSQGTVSPDEYVKNHPGGTHDIHRKLWADNNTPKPIFDKNELKLWPGGPGNTGIDAHGNFVYDVKHMTADGSFHKDFSADAQKLMGEGKLKMLISLSRGTQMHVFEVPIDTDGNAVIDPNSEVGRLAFQNVDGHMKFLGSTAEVAQSVGEHNGVDDVVILATDVGKGLDSVGDVTDVVKNASEVTLNVPKDYDVPITMPIFMRRTPLERAKKLDDEKDNRGTVPNESSDKETKNGEMVKLAKVKESKTAKKSVIRKAEKNEESSNDELEGLPFEEKMQKVADVIVGLENLKKQTEAMPETMPDKSAEENKGKITPEQKASMLTEIQSFLEEKQRLYHHIKVDEEVSMLTKIYDSEKKDKTPNVALRNKLKKFYKNHDDNYTLATVMDKLSGANLLRGIRSLKFVSETLAEGDLVELGAALEDLESFTKANK
ncbi:MAG: hypothetical protein RL641_272 [Candidatus Parcubacteria bacterium]